MVLVAQGEAVRRQLGQRYRVEPQGALAGFQAGEAALDEVERAGHGAQMDALSSGATLEVGDVSAQGLLAVGPGVRAPGAGQDHPWTRPLRVEPWLVRAR